MHAICKNTVTLQAVSFAPGDSDYYARPANLLDGNNCRVMCEDNLTAIQMDKQRQLIKTSTVLLGFVFLMNKRPSYLDLIVSTSPLLAVTITLSKSKLFGSGGVIIIDENGPMSPID
jgi:hypothetical protein